MTLPGKQRKDRSDVGACQGGRKRHSASRGGCLPDLRRQRRREEERQTKPATTHDPRRCQLNHELVPAEENLNRIDSFLMIPASLFAEEPYRSLPSESKLLYGRLLGLLRLSAGCRLRIPPGTGKPDTGPVSASRRPAWDGCCTATGRRQQGCLPRWKPAGCCSRCRGSQTARHGGIT